MAKKKKTYFQAISYTTDQCDGDLIVPECWDPTEKRAKAATEIMTEIEGLYTDYIGTKKHPGPEYLVIECKHNSVTSCEWDYKSIKRWSSNKKYIQQLKDWLAAGEIETIMITSPEYVNLAGVKIEERSDVYHINSFTL